MAVQSLDLTLDLRSDEAVHACWEAVTAVGARSEGERTGESHRPHLTLFAGAEMDQEMLDLAASELQHRFPLRLPVTATVVFGGGPFVVAHLVMPTPALTVLQQRLRDLAGGGSTRPWVPHLTLAKKVTDDYLGAVLAAAAEHRPDFIDIDHLRHWDPTCRTVTTLM